MAKDDNLGLSLETRPFSVPKARVNFHLFHSLVGRLVWAPLRYDNGLLAYGEEEHLHTFLTNLTRAPQKEAQVLEIVMYSFHPRTDLPRKRYFNALEVSVNLSKLVDELLLIRGRLRDIHGKFRAKEPQKRISMLLLDLGPQELAELAREPLKARFQMLLDSAADERLFIFVLVQYGAQVPVDLLPLFEWQAWLGDGNVQKAREYYRDLPEEPYNVSRRMVGLLKLLHEDRTICLHNLIYEASDFRVKMREVAAIEEDAFKSLLSGLD